ncbi:MAG: hypothetical protein L6V88_02575 [Anaerotruncus sp.]|nr:MAG: hypothetical protein L6V88_02575 [Anaerotruncus sp.]
MCSSLFGGFFKKIVVADRAAILVNNVFNHNEKNTAALLLLRLFFFYTLQLYCEFSGVMDVVNGMGQMMGIEMPPNFNRPFFAKSINEFWQRWHITLGAWLRDYIFYPISLSKPFMKLAKIRQRQVQPLLCKSYSHCHCSVFFVWFANGFLARLRLEIYCLRPLLLFAYDARFVF